MQGFTRSHTPAHVFRAIIEDVAYHTEHIMRTMRQHNYTPQQLVASGGPTESRLWMHIPADVSNVPIFRAEAGASAAALGAAICASTGAGIDPNVGAASGAMVHVTERIDSNRDTHEAYRFLANKYISTYPQMQALMHQTTRHLARSG